MEEVYNQEYDVVQHINSITRNWNTRDWRYTLTQEWPVNPAPRHQQEAGYNASPIIA